MKIRIYSSKKSSLHSENIYLLQIFKFFKIKILEIAKQL